MSGRNATGSCLCGAVRFEITQAPLWAHNCHCSRCRVRSYRRAFSMATAAAAASAMTVRSSSAVNPVPVRFSVR
mgnify:CR=1 FL=1